jgi:hypothetical protein
VNLLSNSSRLTLSRMQVLVCALHTSYNPLP